MTLLGSAAVAMWWSIRPERRGEFGDWHSHEHFPERMSIPGFRRGSRWTSTTDPDGFFVLYELDAYETLSSKGYLDRLNAPTPWSAKMMPHHLGMVRSQCRIATSFGGGIASALATVRLSPEAGRAADLRSGLDETLKALATRPGLTGAHLLLTETPLTAGPTTEQRIRGADKEADWIVLVGGYEPVAVDEVLAGVLSPQTLRVNGAREPVAVGTYRLAFAMTSRDVAA